MQVQAWELGLKPVQERHCHPRKLTKVQLKTLLHEIVWLAAVSSPRKRPIGDTGR